jgi:hypothetical protein
MWAMEIEKSLVTEEIIRKKASRDYYKMATENAKSREDKMSSALFLLKAEENLVAAEKKRDELILDIKHKVRTKKSSDRIVKAKL